MWLLAVLLLVACGVDSSETGETETDDGACGEVSTWDVSLSGTVESASGPVAGALVTLEDRGWEPGTTLGSAETEADGGFVIEAVGVTSVEDCWGTLLNYVVVAEDGDLRGERGINSPLYDAIASGSLEADISGAPLLVE